MPTPDPLGRLIPDPGDTNDLPGDLARFSMSSTPGPMTVTSRAQANATVQAVTSSGGDPAGLHVWRTDENREERWTGSGWEYVAGRQHGATVHFARQGVGAGGVGLLHATSFQRASPGWTINGNAWLVVPQTGFYLMYATVSVSGAAGNLGRQFAQFTNRAGGSMLGREGIANENNYSVGAVLWALTGGQELQINVHHAEGGTRDYTATLNIAMINSPNW